MNKIVLAIYRIRGYSNILDGEFNFRMSKKSNFKIVPYHERYSEAFKALNEAWIRKYFKMEEMDHLILGHPKEHILNPGGYIAVALINEEVVGVCALIRSDDTDYDYELSKMGVAPKTQGKGIGWQLGQHIIEQAQKRGAKKIFLDSNTRLKPAIHLYQKLGFVEVDGFDSHYERCDIRMELVFHGS